MPHQKALIIGAGIAANCCARLFGDTLRHARFVPSKRGSVPALLIGDASQRRLCIHCRDDGVGIPAENLTRIFESGFSTKSRETNQGIGLHWCANAVNALGGRIWAESDGDGHGASFHVEVPLGVGATSAAATPATSLAGAA